MTSVTVRKNVSCYNTGFLLAMRLEETFYVPRTQRFYKNLCAFNILKE